MRRFLTFPIIVIMAIFLVACGDSEAGGSDSGDDNSKSDEEIVFGLINWPENIAVNHGWKVLLEEQGYEVDVKQLEMGTIMEALSTGDLDVGIEVWLPVQDISYYEQYKDTVDFNETPWFENGKVGIVVPEYMEDINSVEDLNDHKDLFEGEIIGFEPGAGTMEVTETLIEDYNLDFELVPSSEAAMLGALREAIKDEEPIVVSLWQPHGIFSDLDLKFLDGPQETYGAEEEMYLAKGEGFADVSREIYRFSIYLEADDDDTMAELINFVNESDDPLEGAKEWVEENRDLTDEWMK